MKEKLYQYINEKYEGATIWNYDASVHYVYIRFTHMDRTHVLCYYKGHGSVEIFELKAGELL